MEQCTLPIEAARLFDQLCSTNTLVLAFKEVRKNKGAPGIDGVTIKAFTSRLKEELAQLSKDLQNWDYKPSPVKRVDIPKPAGGTRMLGIPRVRDRVVQAGIKLLLEPILDRQFSENSFGFRPKRNQRQAVEQAKRIVESGKPYVVDIDLSKFFDRINHDRLITQLSEHVPDKRILRLIGMTLRSGIMKDGMVTATVEGTTQGSPLSPLLSNLVLDKLDKELERKGLEFCRFADDCNIFVASQKAAERVMASTCKYIEKRLKLVVNQEKSQVALSHQVKFLGTTIVNATIAISKKAIDRAMTKVKELTPRGTAQTIQETIEGLNRWYRGWSSYFSMTEYPAQLKKIEAHIRRRLRSRIVSQQKRRRYLYNKLIKREVKPKMAYKAVYSNRGRWAMSHTRAVEKAYSNKWFADEMGLFIRSGDNLPHWFELKQWVYLT
jgi:group II intron reverse transcriptase/maturase